MACLQFVVLYTHQKTKKSKTWQDGTLKLSPEGNKATLFDDKGQRLDCVYVKTNEIKAGDDLESDRYLITVEATKYVENGKSDIIFAEKEQLCSVRDNSKPLNLHQLPSSTGLKRKGMGFRGPCLLRKKRVTEEVHSSTASFQAKSPWSSLPSQLYTTSPLFTTLSKKEPNIAVPKDCPICNTEEMVSPVAERSVSRSDVFSEGVKGSDEGKMPTVNQSWSGVLMKKTDVQPTLSMSALPSKQILEDTPSSGVSSKNIRSTAQILSLLKSGTTSQIEEMAFETAHRQHKLNEKVTTNPNPIQQCMLLPEGIADVLGECKNAMQWSAVNSDVPSLTVAKSRWDAYLPQKLNVHSSGKNSPEMKLQNNSYYEQDLGNCLCTLTADPGMDGLEKKNRELTDCRTDQNIFTDFVQMSSADHNATYSITDLELVSSERLQSGDHLHCTSLVNQDSGMTDISSDKDKFIKSGSHLENLSQNEFCVDTNQSLKHLPLSNSKSQNLDVYVRVDPEQVQSLSENSLDSLRNSQCGFVEDFDCSAFIRKYTRKEMLNDHSVNFNLLDNLDFAKLEDLEETALSQSSEDLSKQSVDSSFDCIQAENHDKLETTPTEKDVCVKGLHLKSITVLPMNFSESQESVCVKTENSLAVCHTDMSNNTAGAAASFVSHTPMKNGQTAANLLNDCSLSESNPTDQNEDELIFQSSESAQKSTENANIQNGNEGEEEDSLVFVSKGGIPSLDNTFSNCCSEYSHKLVVNSLINSESSDLTNDKEVLFSGILSSVLLQRSQGKPEKQSLLMHGCCGSACSENQSDLLHSNDSVHVGYDPLHCRSQNSDTELTASVYEESSFSDCNKPKAEVKTALTGEYTCRQSVLTFEEGNIEPIHPSLGIQAAFVYAEYKDDTSVPSGDDISILKSLSTHSSALESLEILKEKSAKVCCERALQKQLHSPVQDIKECVRLSHTEGRTLKLQARLQLRSPVVTVPSDYCEKEKHFCFNGASKGSKSLSSKLSVKQTSPGDIEAKSSISIGTDEVNGDRTKEPVTANTTAQSKWEKYRNTASLQVMSQNKECILKVTDHFSAHDMVEMPVSEDKKKEEVAVQKQTTVSSPFQLTKDSLVRNYGLIKRGDKIMGNPLQGLEQAFPVNKYPEMFSIPNSCNPCSVTRNASKQNVSLLDFSFPSSDEVQCATVPKRQIIIPITFQSAVHYKQVFTAALTEHLNILLFDLSQRLHKALAKVNISQYLPVQNGEKQSLAQLIPYCHHQQPAKLVMVKKVGPNKGRFFFTCDAAKNGACKFFKWLEEVKCPDSKQGGSEGPSKIMMSDPRSLAIYARGQHIFLYGECQLLVRKVNHFLQRQFSRSKLRKIATEDTELANGAKTKLYLRLSRKESSSTYSKDDIWVISKSLTFDSLDTFIACSVFFGPSSSNEVEILPLKGYSPSNWPCNTIVHALLACNASTELAYLRNLQEHASPATLPLMPYLLKLPSKKEPSSRFVKGKFVSPTLISNTNKKSGLLTLGRTVEIANEMKTKFHLNTDQAEALIHIAKMMATNENSADLDQQQIHPITIIHGVFGAGKSYLLAVVILFLLHLFEESNEADDPRKIPWKILVSSCTNVAVDQVLLRLLDLGFDKFIRVGSIRKIAKPVLPYSLHAGSGNDSEQLKELHDLLKEDLTPAEKVYVRKSIEQHKIGSIKTRLGQMQVVGVTCAACPFSCMNNLKFPVVILDECSQMMEPASLLPIARFECEKLILVGDPKQLSPTIQGSEGSHENGLEQTLLDRLSLMGYETILLRTQYRCHPAISAIANDLFYSGCLVDGVSEKDRSPLLNWLPTLCFYNVKGTEQADADGSFHNPEEATFTIKLIQSLIAGGIIGSMIGVITLYRSQMQKLCSLICSTVFCDPTEMKAVQVSTVDAFQGAEKEIIVLSCVRSRHVGFIDSEKRTNVALTRGKRHLLIVGNLQCLYKNKLWGRVIQHCKGSETGLRHASEFEQELDSITETYLDKNDEDRCNREHKEKGHTQKPDAHNARGLTLCC